VSKRYLFVSWVVALALAVPMAAHAQSKQPSKPLSGGDSSSMLVSAGLTFEDFGGETGIGAAANVLFNTLKTTGNGRIGVVGDVGINHFDGATVSSILGGGRYTFTTSGKVSPSAEFMVGILHCCGNTNFDPAFGAGVDIAWKPNMNFRGAVDFIFDDVTATRWFFGISMPIAKK
jgi:hypothetical protein